VLGDQFEPAGLLVDQSQAGRLHPESTDRSFDQGIEGWLQGRGGKHGLGCFKEQPEIFNRCRLAHRHAVSSAGRWRIAGRCF